MCNYLDNPDYVKARNRQYYYWHIYFSNRNVSEHRRQAALRLYRYWYKKMGTLEKETEDKGANR